MKKERLWVFTKLDLIIPWGTGIGAAVLCTLAAIYGVPMADGVAVARTISILTGLVFLASIPIWYFVRSRLRKYHYKTVHGLYVIQGNVNRPKLEEVEAWTVELLNHWAGAAWTRPDGTKVLVGNHIPSEAIEGKTVFFRDEEKLSVWGRWVRAYAETEDVVIGWAARVDYVHGLFLHELSHLVLLAAGEPWDETWHHSIFQQTKLGE